MMSQHSHKRLPCGNDKKDKHVGVEAGPASPKAAEMKATHSNRLLAGYLAHEFLTKGTLMGRKFEHGLGGSSSSEPKRSEEQDSYVEVANILKTDGAHIKGIVNPTQLSNWINKS